MSLESDKKELLLGIDTFNKPSELIGKNAWSQLILNLLFLEPGTYPSMPEMGIGIRNYEYEFIDDAINELPEKIKTQVRLYLPDIPLVDVTASKYYGEETNNQAVLVLVLSFNDNGKLETSAIAATVGRSLLDFDISWS